VAENDVPATGAVLIRRYCAVTKREPEGKVDGRSQDRYSDGDGKRMHMRFIGNRSSAWRSGEMAVGLAELVTQLKVLRKGRGLFVNDIDERIGSALREVCDVTDDDGPAAIRQKIAEWLEDLSRDLPADLRVAVLAAFAISPDARLPLYQDRVGWTATRLNRDPRTARRRIDDGILQLAQLATAGLPAIPSAAKTAPEPETGWHTTELRVMLALDRAHPEAVEQRRIVSDQDDLVELDLPVTLAVPSEHRELTVDIFYGGTLVDRGMETSERHAFALALPRALARGETHDIALQFRLPGQQVMRPYFVCVPKRPCTLFDLRVRFDRDRSPARVWLLHGSFQRDVDDPALQGETRPVDQSAEIHLTFRDLIPGLAYGARWDY
jgi:hypothetical protein